MKNKPWLEKEDPQWSQQVKWNYSREAMFSDWDDREGGKECPLIEEAHWYISTIIDMDVSKIIAYQRFTKRFPEPRALTYIGIINRSRTTIAQAAVLGDAIAQCRFAMRQESIDDQEA